MVGQKQREWLAKDLETVDKATPLVVFSHSPIQKIDKGWNFWTEDAWGPPPRANGLHLARHPVPARGVLRGVRARVAPGRSRRTVGRAAGRRRDPAEPARRGARERRLMRGRRRSADAPSPALECLVQQQRGVDGGQAVTVYGAQSLTVGRPRRPANRWAANAAAHTAAGTQGRSRRAASCRRGANIRKAATPPAAPTA